MGLRDANGRDVGRARTQAERDGWRDGGMGMRCAWMRDGIAHLCPSSDSWTMGRLPYDVLIG
jgi:hypothetical protein